VSNDAHQVFSIPTCSVPFYLHQPQDVYRQKQNMQRQHRHKVVERAIRNKGDVAQYCHDAQHPHVGHDEGQQHKCGRHKTSTFGDGEYGKALQRLVRLPLDGTTRLRLHGSPRTRTHSRRGWQSTSSYKRMKNLRRFRLSCRNR
jgi:hypothetical protein